MRDSTLLRALAASFLAGELTFERIVARASQTLGHPWRWLRPVARRFAEATAGKTRPRLRDTVQLLIRDPTITWALTTHAGKLHLAQRLTSPPAMAPVPAAAAWPLPAIESPAVLADWLWLEPAELLWLADLKGLAAKSANPTLTHYHYRVLAKPSGGIRLIEAPKPRLKQAQRQILDYLLALIPPHPAAHGFVTGRSIQSFAAPHTAQSVVLRIDLENFFPSFPSARVQTLFRTAGYPEPVADLLGGICTNAVPRAVLREHRDAQTLYARTHLPQGAPTSPALANICTYRADCRLTGLARAAGATYSRYADDLAFSGGPAFSSAAQRFAAQAAAILAEEGLRVNYGKTRIMRQGVRQHLAGLTTNQHLNLSRPAFDLLKATLTNCIRLGPATQNRDAHPDFRSHLQGRVAFAESINPAKAKRLRALFNQIQW